MIQLIQGDCLEKMRDIPDGSVDLVLTDPPYGLSFMGKKWDYDVPTVEVWQECLRVLKPGGYLLAFAGTRTQHRMAVRIEDAGFEIRDMIAWVYGSGFPKSLNIGKAVDKLQGNEREVIGERLVPDQRGGGISSERTAETGGVKTRLTQDTKGTSEWEGWGTALKPSLEPITVARKPLIGTVAENVLTYGTGGLNIDGCRVEILGAAGVWGAKQSASVGYNGGTENSGYATQQHPQGRFPANLIHDGSEEVVELFPVTKTGKVASHSTKGMWGSGADTSYQDTDPGGSAARFFYCAKASKSERNRGCEGLDEKETKRYGDFRGTEEHAPKLNVKNTNNHPTVKPIALMEYLVTLASREGATVLDPFMGSGTTGVACKNLNRNFIGIELDPEYYEIAKNRIAAASIPSTHQQPLLAV